MSENYANVNSEKRPEELNDPLPWEDNSNDVDISDGMETTDTSDYVSKYLRNNPLYYIRPNQRLQRHIEYTSLYAESLKGRHALIMAEAVKGLDTIADKTKKVKSELEDPEAIICLLEYANRYDTKELLESEDDFIFTDELNAEVYSFAQKTDEVKRLLNELYMAAERIREKAKVLKLTSCEDVNSKNYVRAHSFPWNRQR